MTTPVVKTSPPQTPSEQTATTPKPSSFRNLRRQAGLPTGVAATLSRSDCTGGAAWQSFSELRHSRNNPQNKRPHPPPIVIPEFSAWLTLVLEQCRAENIRNLPRERAPTPLFPERRPREACSMPISGCHDLPLATFNLPSRVFRHGCRRAKCPKRRWGGFFHTLHSAHSRLPVSSSGIEPSGSATRGGGRPGDGRLPPPSAPADTLRPS